MKFEPLEMYTTVFKPKKPHFLTKIAIISKHAFRNSGFTKKPIFLQRLIFFDADFCIAVQNAAGD